MHLQLCNVRILFNPQEKRRKTQPFGPKIVYLSSEILSEYYFFGCKQNVLTFPPSSTQSLILFTKIHQKFKWVRIYQKRCLSIILSSKDAQFCAQKTMSYEIDIVCLSQYILFPLHFVCAQKRFSFQKELCSILRTVLRSIRSWLCKIVIQ